MLQVPVADAVNHSPVASGLQLETLTEQGELRPLYSYYAANRFLHAGGECHGNYIPKPDMESLFINYGFTMPGGLAYLFCLYHTVLVSICAWLKPLS